MIERVMEDVQLAVGYEVMRAKAEHGERYASVHEAYGVLADELYEAEIEYHEVSAYAGMLLRAIHKGDHKLLRAALGKVRYSAVRAACELVQVAAVCDKALQGLEADADVLQSD